MYLEEAREETRNEDGLSDDCDYAPKAKSMAAEVEKKANEMEQEDWELVSFAITNSAKGILVFHRPDNDFRD